MMIGIGGANYFHWYRLQPTPLIIGSITSITIVSYSANPYQLFDPDNSNGPPIDTLSINITALGAIY